MTPEQEQERQDRLRRELTTPPDYEAAFAAMFELGRRMAEEYERRILAAVFGEQKGQGHE